MFEREDDSSSTSDESSEESDDDASDSHDSDTGVVRSEERKDREAEQTTHSCQLPRIKMPNTSKNRRSQPCVEVLRSSDSNEQDTGDDKLH